MSTRVTVHVDPYSRAVLIKSDGRPIALTRDEAAQLRDDITRVLDDPGAETPEQRQHRELHDGSRTYLPPEKAA